MFEKHRDKVEDVSLELLRAFLHECRSVAQDTTSCTELSSRTLNSATHFRLDISTSHLNTRVDTYRKGYYHLLHVVS